ncbi:MAG: DNA polymerase IV [Solirubrobacterales bacterium]|nr:DNA polymerase IV [Solirubrobacterales bacterium]
MEEDPETAVEPEEVESSGASGPFGDLGRTIAHLDLDAFFVSAELLRRPELKGLPVIVSGSGPRAVVTTASYEAREFGVGSAMPTAKALRLCPEAVVIPPDSGEYRRLSGLVLDLIRHHVPLVEPAGLDEAYADLSGMVTPSAAMRKVVQDIRVDTGLHASVGIGPNKLVAKVASDADKPDGFVVLTQTQARLRFADSPCRILPGVGPKTRERLERLEIFTVGELAAADEVDLVQIFGPRQGPWLKDRGRFIDSAAVTPNREAVSESRETTFDVDVVDSDVLKARLDRLVDELCKGLNKHGHKGRTIGVKVRYSDFDTHTKARTLEESVSDPDRVGAVAHELFDALNAGKPIRLLGVRVAGFNPVEGKSEDPQLSLPIP